MKDEQRKTHINRKSRKNIRGPYGRTTRKGRKSKRKKKYKY